MKYCKNCGKENSDDAKFCVQCGSSFNEVQPNGLIRIRVNEEPANNLNKVSRAFAVASAAFTVFGFNASMAVLGLLLCVVSVGICVYGIINKKIKGSLKISIFLNLYALIGNFTYLAYHLWIAKSI